MWYNIQCKDIYQITKQYNCTDILRAASLDKAIDPRYLILDLGGVQMVDFN